MLTIEVKITERCNQRCFHCVNLDGGPSGEDINHLLIIDRLREQVLRGGCGARKVREVRITGGEPLLNMPGMTAIAECCADLGIKCGINTNGLLLADGDVLARLKDSGIRIIKISLDSLDSETYDRMRGKRNRLDKVLEGIGSSVKYGFEVMVRFTITALNRDELLPCYRYACEAGAARFQVKPLIAAGLGTSSRAGLSPDELSEAFRELSLARESSSSCSPEILCTPPSEAFGMAAKTCGSVNKIYIAVNGNVCSCNFVPGRKLGSIVNMTISEILDRRLELERFRNIRGESSLEGCPRYAKPVAGLT